MLPFLIALPLWTAAAGDTRVVLFEIEGDDFSARQMALLRASVLAEANKRDGVHARDATQTERETQSYRACEDGCLAKFIAAFGTSEVLTGRIATLGGETIFSMRRIDIARPELVTSATRRLKGADGVGVLAAVDPMVNELFPGHSLTANTQPGVSVDLQLRWAPKPLPPGLFWSGAALTVGLGVGAAAAGVSAVHARDEYEAAIASGTRENPVSGREVIELEDRFQARKQLTNILWVGTGVIGLATALTFAFTDWGEDPVLSAAPTEGGATVLGRIRF